MAIGYTEYDRCSSPECLTIGERFRQEWRNMGIKPMRLNEVIRALRSIQEQKTDIIAKEALANNPIVLAWLHMLEENDATRATDNSTG
jgi:hypothetical protein